MENKRRISCSNPSKTDQSSELLTVGMAFQLDSSIDVLHHVSCQKTKERYRECTIFDVAVMVAMPASGALTFGSSVHQSVINELFVLFSPIRNSDIISNRKHSGGGGGGKIKNVRKEKGKKLEAMCPPPPFATSYGATTGRWSCCDG